jgi:hypothetical protein
VPCRAPRAGVLWAAAAAAGALLASASPARAGDAEEVQAAPPRVEAAKEAEAIPRCEVLLDPDAPPCPQGPELTPEGCRLTNPDLVAAARGQYALALFAEGRTNDVYAQVEAILRAQPGYQPNAALFPQRLVDIFVEVRGRLAEEIAEAARKKAELAQRAKEAEEARAREEAAYVAALEKQAGEESVLLERSRLYAFVPFGVGQIQNGDVGLGVGFATFEALAGISSIVTFVAKEDLEAQAFSTANRDDAATQSLIDGWTLANRISFGMFAGAALIGVIEANVSYEDAVPETRARPLPRRRPELTSFAPVVAPTEGGAMVGATGRF